MVINLQTKKACRKWKNCIICIQDVHSLKNKKNKKWYLKTATVPMHVHNYSVFQLRNKAVGKDHLGNKAVGNDHLGNKAVGKDHLGNKAVGKDHLGNKAVGRDHLGNKAVGKDHLGNKAVGKDHLVSYFVDHAIKLMHVLIISGTNDQCSVLPFILWSSISWGTFSKSKGGCS